jgi:hypothetical protein
VAPGEHLQGAAVTLDLAAIMRTLATKRPIFNSEADFQLAPRSTFPIDNFAGLTGGAIHF